MTSTCITLRLCGTITVDIGDKLTVEVGLAIKYARKSLMVAGFARRVADSRRPDATVWEFRLLGEEEGGNIENRGFCKIYQNICLDFWFSFS